MGLSRREKNLSNPLPPRGGAERRTVCRYAVVQDRAWVGWWEGAKFESTAARILDISLRGAFLNVDRFPPLEVSTWFCPPGVDAKDDWLEMKVLEVRKRIFGKREARVIFRNIFPYEIFKAVVYGPDAFRSREQPNWRNDDTAENHGW